MYSFDYPSLHCLNRFILTQIIVIYPVVGLIQKSVFCYSFSHSKCEAPMHSFIFLLWHFVFIFKKKIVLLSPSWFICFEFYHRFQVSFYSSIYFNFCQNGNDILGSVPVPSASFVLSVVEFRARLKFSFLCYSRRHAVRNACFAIVGVNTVSWPLPDQPSINCTFRVCIWVPLL